MIMSVKSVERYRVALPIQYERLVLVFKNNALLILNHMGTCLKYKELDPRFSFTDKEANMKCSCKANEICLCEQNI